MADQPYLLDTNIVLHATRQGSIVSKAIDQQFNLSASRFRPAISEVSIGELVAFTQSQSWGQRRRDLLAEQIASCLVVPISHPGVHARWAEIATALKGAGITVGQNDVWIAATASITDLTVLTTDQDFCHFVRLGLVRAEVLHAKTGLRSPC
jgi:tRNA(fMet)-specific endonuclease VapC